MSTMMSTIEQKKENTSSRYGVKQSCLVNKVNISSLRASSKLSKPSGSKDAQKRPQTTEKTHISKPLPLSEKNQNVPQTPTNQVAKSSSAGTNPPSTAKRTWRVPAHSGVPLSVTKSPAVSKGVTKPRSTTKRKKLPAHSGVPVSFGKRQALNFLLMDD